MSDMDGGNSPAGARSDAGDDLRSDYNDMGSLASDMGVRTPSRLSSHYGMTSPHASGLESFPNSVMGTPGSRRDRVNINRGAPTRIFNTPGRARQENMEQDGEPASSARQPSEPMEQDGQEGQRTVIWGTNVDIESVERNLRQFFSEFKENETDEEPFYKNLMTDVKLKLNTRHQIDFINIDGGHIHTFNPRLYTHLIQFVTDIIPIMDFVASELFTEWCDGPERFLTCRPFNLRHETAMRELNPDDVNKLVSIRGMVIRTSQIVPDMRIAFFQCSACEHVQETNTNQGRIPEPTTCEHCNRKFTMNLVHNRSKFLDKQIIKLQEAPDMMPAGQTPHTVVLVCYDDLVETVQPGDRLDVTGIFRGTTMRPNKNQRAIKAVMKTYLDVVHYKRSGKGKLARVSTGNEADSRAESLVEDQPDAEKEAALAERIKKLSQDPELYPKLVRAIAPSIWGCEDIKKGLLCMLFGGVPPTKTHKGNNMRGDINVLLCGDPGVSKSQFLSLVHKISSRGIYTSGKGSSSVGLTAYVTKDPESKELVLESGALVLSDGGICCIDEFDKMSEQTRSVLHEAMEQQTISIAKAGIICTLNARASILAAANPRNSSYDTSMTITDNINLPPPLLSRFDLIYLVIDKVDVADDERLARHIVAMYEDKVENHQEGELTLDALTEYVSYARANIHPKINDEAAAALTQGYVTMRRFGSVAGRKVISATTRQLESLIRVSESLARMRLSSVVEASDVDEAIRLVRDALQTASINPETGTIDMSIINTGRSETARLKIGNVSVAVQDYIRDVQLNKHKLKDILEYLNKGQQGTMIVSMNELRQACVSPALKDQVVLTDGETSIQVLG